MKITSLAISAAAAALTASMPSATARISSPEGEQVDIKNGNGQSGGVGGIHPVTSMDDPRLRNPWAGLNVHSSSAQQQQRQLKKPTASARPPAKEKPNKPDKGGGPGGPATSTPTPAPANAHKAIIVGAGPGGW